jgi:transposase-like protein
VTATDILGLPGWLVRDVQGNAEHLIIEAQVDEVPSACPWCGSVRPPYHFGTRRVQLADLPIRMRPVIILARRRRYRCRDCSRTFLDQLPGIHHRHEATERLVSYVQRESLCLTQTFTGLALSLGVSEWLIRDIFTAHVEALERDYVIQTPRYLGSVASSSDVRRRHFGKIAYARTTICKQSGNRSTCATFSSDFNHNALASYQLLLLVEIFYTRRGQNNSSVVAWCRLSLFI